VPKTSSKTHELAGLRSLAWRRLVSSSSPSPSATISSRTALCRDLAASNFASVWIDSLGGGLVVRVRDGEFPAACGLRQAIALAIHRQDVDVVGQPVEKRAGQRR
jgi:hypothetical protein